MNLKNTEESGKEEDGCSEVEPCLCHSDGIEVEGGTCCYGEGEIEGWVEEEGCSSKICAYASGGL